MGVDDPSGGNCERLHHDCDLTEAISSILTLKVVSHQIPPSVLGFESNKAEAGASTGNNDGLQERQQWCSSNLESLTTGTALRQATGERGGLPGHQAHELFGHGRLSSKGRPLNTTTRDRLKQLSSASRMGRERCTKRKEMET